MMHPIEFYGGYQVYSESGVDLTLLRENLKRTIEERLASNARALRFVEAFQESSSKKGMPEKQLSRRVPMLDEAAILQQLTKHHVAFVVIRGLAMRIQGSAPCH